MWLSMYAEGMDPISGGGGWVGAGLLGLLLGWLLLKHLPEKDKQLAEKDQLHAKVVDDLRLAHTKALSDANDKHAKVVNVVLEHCKEEVRVERDLTERHHKEHMEFLNKVYSSSRESIHATRGLAQTVVNRQSMADALQSAEVPMWTKSLDGTIMAWNGACERLLYWKQGEVVGHSVYDHIIPNDRREEEDEVLRRIAEGETVEPYETVRMSKSGRRVTLVVTTSPIRDQTGKVIGASTVVHPAQPTN